MQNITFIATVETQPRDLMRHMPSTPNLDLDSLEVGNGQRPKKEMSSTNFKGRISLSADGKEGPG